MNPIEGFMGGFGQEVGKAVVDMLLPILEPKLDALVAEVTAQVKTDVQQLLVVAHADLGKALSDMGTALKGDL